MIPNELSDQNGQLSKLSGSRQIPQLHQIESPFSQVRKREPSNSPSHPFCRRSPKHLGPAPLRQVPSNRPLATRSNCCP